MIVSPRGYLIGRSDDAAPNILTTMPKVPFVLLYELKRTPPVISSPPSGDFVTPNPPRPAPVVPDESPFPPFGSQDVVFPSPPKNKDPVKPKTAKPVHQSEQMPTAPPQNLAPPRPNPNDVQFCHDLAAFNGLMFQNSGNQCGLNSCINGILECSTFR